MADRAGFLEEFFSSAGITRQIEGFLISLNHVRTLGSRLPGENLGSAGANFGVRIGLRQIEQRCARLGIQLLIEEAVRRRGSCFRIW